MGFIAGPANVAVGQTTPQAIVDRGTLVLELGTVDRFALYDAADQLVGTQAISDQACKLSLSTADDVLVTLAAQPTTSDVGIFADGIGVKTKGGPGGGNGQPCGRADGPNEGLTLRLAGDLGDREIARAELDVEGKFGVQVEAALYNDGGLVGTASLQTGDQSDSGPDSADGDNYRWEIDPGADMVADVLFDEIRLTVAATTSGGAFSLEGGADGTASGSLGISGSAFALVEQFDGVIPCGDDTFTVGDGASTPQATFTRGDDDDKNPDPCTALIGYNLDSAVGTTDQTVTFEFETEEAPSWFGTFTWTPEPAAMPVPATQVDLDGDGSADRALVWCNGFSGTDTATGNPLPVMPGGESWCVVTQTSTLIGSGTIQVTQTIYGETDPSFARPK